MDKLELIKKYENYLDATKKYFQLQEEYENTNKQYIEFCEKEKEIRDGIPGLASIIFFVFVIMGFVITDSIIGVIIGFILGLLGVKIYMKITKAKVKNAKKADEYHVSVVVPAGFECERVREQINCHLDSAVMKRLFTDIPEEFRSIFALEFFLRMLKNRQADTEKECYNLYMEYLQRQQIIDLQDQQIALGQKMLEEQKVQTKMTAELNESAKRQTKSMEEIEKKQKKISNQVRYGNVVNTINVLKKK